MKNIVFTLFMVYAWNTFNYVESRLQQRIVGGNADENNDFNYQVSIQVMKKKIQQFQHACGGSIITAHFVLTAAHCFVSRDDTRILDVSHNNVRIIAGTNRQDDENGIYRFVDKVYLNKNFSHSMPSGDIAVIKLDKKLDVEGNPRVSVIKIPKFLKYERLVNRIATASGFGVMNFQANPSNPNSTATEPIMPNTRQYLKVKIISKEKCKPYDFIICTLSAINDSQSHGICNGDSGGPLVYNNNLIGILSRGPDSCNMKKSAATFTLVPYFNDFIMRAVTENGDKSDMRILDGFE